MKLFVFRITYDNFKIRIQSEDGIHDKTIDWDQKDYPLNNASSYISSYGFDIIGYSEGYWEKGTSFVIANFNHKLSFNHE